MKELTCNTVSLVDSFSAIIFSSQQNKLCTVCLQSYNGTVKTRPKSSNPSTFLWPLNGGDKPGTMFAKALSRSAFRRLYPRNESIEDDPFEEEDLANLKTIMVGYMLNALWRSMFPVMMIPQSVPA